VTSFFSTKGKERERGKHTEELGVDESLCKNSPRGVINPFPNPSEKTRYLESKKKKNDNRKQKFIENRRARLVCDPKGIR
jgi:hypothetical protein